MFLGLTNEQTFKFGTADLSFYFMNFVLYKYSLNTTMPPNYGWVCVRNYNNLCNEEIKYVFRKCIDNQETLKTSQGPAWHVDNN